MPSDLERAIAQYRADLLANEAKATLAIGNAYKVTRERLIARINDLADAIAEDGAEFTASEVLKWQRAQTLLRQVEAEMSTLATASAQPIEASQSAAVELAGDQAKGLALATAQSAGADAIAATIDTTWNRLNTGAAEAMVGRMSDGSPLRDWLGQFGKQQRSILGDALQSAAALGTNPRDVARMLQGKVDASAARLLLMSRTEILGAQRAATMQNYQDNADIVDGFIWISAHQDRTCLACLSLDGQFFPLTVDFQPSHVGCRCSSRASVKGVDMARRGIRTGEEWFKAQPEAVQREMIPKALWDDYASGKITLADFRHLHEDDRWGASYREATIPQARANAARRVEASRFISPSAPKFTTVADAEKYARSNLAKNVSYEGVTVNTANRINTTIAENQTRYPLKRQIGNLVITKDRKVIGNRQYAVARPAGIAMHPVRIQDEAHLKTNDTLSVPPKPGNPKRWSTSTSIERIVTHEYAHLIEFERGYNQVGLTIDAHYRLKLSPQDRASFRAAFTEYGFTDNSEFWAECYTMYVYERERLPQSMIDAIEGILKNDRMEGVA